MKKMKRPLPYMPIVFFVLAVFILTKAAMSSDFYASISKNLTVLGQVYKEVSNRYVDKIDPDDFLRAGVDGMLNTLDPYTVYLEKEEDRHQLQVLTNGKYGGVGLLLIYRNNTVIVGEPPFLGTPSEKAGIHEGDRIIKVDSVWTRDLDFNEAAQHIRGPAGTEVTLTIYREGEPVQLVFKMTREQIKIDDVRYAGFIQEGIGYIRLTRFSRNANQEVREAIHGFKEKGLNGLILDLRNNPGGLLESSVKISDLFLPEKALVVSTRGRTKSSIREFPSEQPPLFGDLPLIVLVNGFSASASEIVAGAIQDHDRGIVMGDTTFGKGLVQTIVPITRESAIKITTAKYFTPSGRSIQRQNYSHWEDSTGQKENMAYHTDSGRPVFGKGGIAPDIVVTLPPANGLTIDLRRKSMFFNFAVHYASIHENIDSTIPVTDAILKQFQEYLREKEYYYKHPIENSLSALHEEAEEQGYNSQLIQSIQNLQLSLDQVKSDMFEKSKSDIIRILRIELTSKYYGTHRGVEISMEDDFVVQKAVELINDPKQYETILKK